ncbi:MAG: hypothetical protein H7844_07560 [Nitrospirae bacterium YQR-1]
MTEKETVKEKVYELFNKTPEHGKESPKADIALEEQIKAANISSLQLIITDISKIESEALRSLHISRLATVLKIPKKSIEVEVKKLRTPQKVVSVSENIEIVHAAYDVKEDFVTLGFRETIVADNSPQDVNFFIVASDGGYELCTGTFYETKGKKIVFDLRGRTLVNVNDRWEKRKINEFIENPVVQSVYQEVKATLKQYLELPKEPFYGLVAAWIIGTYFHRQFNAYPFVFVYGKKQSGKSRLLDVLFRLSFNAMKIKGVSVAALADSIDGVRGTFLNDQAEALSDPKNTEILGILADSYTPDGGNRRIVDISNKTRKVIEFNTYAPKVFASIREIDSDLKDRCVMITMLRALKDYPYPEPHLSVWPDLRDKLYRLLLTRWLDVRRIYPKTGAGVTQRVKELWRPLETILCLEQVSEIEIADILSVFLESMQQTQSGLDERELTLFEALFKLLSETDCGQFTASEIALNMTDADSLFRTEKSKTTWVGRALTRLNLYERIGNRIGNKQSYFFTLEHVRDVYSRFFPSNLATSTATCNIMQHIKNDVAEDKPALNKALCDIATSSAVSTKDHINLDLFEAEVTL